MKKILALMCLVSAVVIFAACNNAETSGTTEATTTTVTSESTQATTSAIVEPYVEEEKDENGNVTKKSYYNEYKKLEKMETFLEGGKPETVYEYNAQGMALKYTLYTYDENGNLQLKYCENGTYNSAGLVLTRKETLTYDANDKLLSHGISLYDAKGAPKSVRVLYYNENGIVNMRDETKVEEYHGNYSFLTERYDMAGVLIRREEQWVHKTTGEIIKSVIEVMQYENGVLVSITKTEPQSSSVDVTVTYYNAEGKMTYAEGARYNSDSTVQMFFKITYHENGQKKESFSYRPDQTLYFYQRYDTNGWSIARMSLRANGEYYDYTGLSDDRLTEYNITVDREFNLVHGTIDELYKRNGNTKRRTVYEYGNISFTKDFDENGRMIQKEEYKDGVLECVKKYQYTSEDEGVVTTYDTEGNIISSETFGAWEID